MRDADYIITCVEKDPVIYSKEGEKDLFKSKVNKIFDFRYAKVSEELLKIEVDEKEILKQLEDVAKKHSVTADVDDCVRPGDLVTVELESSLEKYNKKNVPISVGMGLFNKNFEEKLLNAKKCEEKTINVDEYAVKTKVLSIKRKMIPKVTDELIAKENIEDVSSVEEYRNYLFNEKVSKIKEERLLHVQYEVLGQVADQSEYLIVDEDVKALCEDELNRCRALSKMEGLVFEEMSEDQLGMRVGQTSLEVFKECIKKGYEKELKTALVGMSMAKEEKVIFNEISYEEHIKEKAKMEAMDVEAAKAMEPFLRYVAFSYTGFLRKKVSEYYGNKFQVI